jgi:hypothetical protein
MEVTYPEIMEHGLVLVAVDLVGFQLVVRPPHSWHLPRSTIHQAWVVALQQPTKDVGHGPAVIFKLQ